LNTTDSAQIMEVPMVVIIKPIDLNNMPISGP
jgi:hypothetical protein